LRGARDNCLRQRSVGTDCCREREESELCTCDLGAWRTAWWRLAAERCAMDVSTGGGGCPICAYRTAVFRRTVLDGSGLRLLPC